MNKHAPLAVAASCFALLHCAAQTSPAEVPAEGPAPGEAEPVEEAQPSGEAQPAEQAVPEKAAPPEKAALPEPAGAASCGQPLLEDLEDGDARSLVVDGRGGYWFTFKDEMGSTVSPDGTFVSAQGGAGGSKHAARMSGKTEASGIVYVGMGFSLTNPVAPYDLSQAKGLCFSAKGKGSVRVKMPDVNTAPEGGVCKECYNDFGLEVALSDEWKEECFDFSALRQQPGWGEQKPGLAADRVFAVQWQLNAPGQDYEVWIDDVRLKCD